MPCSLAQIYDLVLTGPSALFHVRIAPDPRFDPLVPGRRIRVETMASAPSTASLPIIRERVTSLQLQQDSVACELSNRNRLLVSRLLAKHIAVGDEITFSVATEDGRRTEVLITD